MPNANVGDSPLTDLLVHAKHPFPADLEALLLEIDALGRRPGRWPLGENWPFYPRELGWEQGRGLDEGRELLTRLLEMLRAGRGDEILHDPRTRRPFVAGPDA